VLSKTGLRGAPDIINGVLQVCVYVCVCVCVCVCVPESAWDCMLMGRGESVRGFAMVCWSSHT